MNVFDFIRDKRRIIVIILIFIALITIILITPGYLRVSTDQSDFIVTVDGTRNYSPKKTSTSSWLPRGEHVVAITKDGFYSIKKNVSTLSILPVFIKEDLKPKKVLSDLENGDIEQKDGSVISYCDIFKKTVCLGVINGNNDLYIRARDILLSTYKHDDSIPHLYLKNLTNNQVTILNNRQLIVRLVNQEVVDKPVLMAWSNSSLTADMIVDQIRNTTQLEPNDYYIIYKNPTLTNNNNLPSDIDIVWYDEDEQFGATDV